MLYRKTFNAIAHAVSVARMPDEDRLRLATAIASELEQHSTRFDRARFKEACGCGVNAENAPEKRGA